MYFKLEGRQMEVQVGRVITTTFTSFADLGVTRTYSILKLSQAFTIIGIILSSFVAILSYLLYVESTRNKLLFSLGVSAVRFFWVFMSFIIAVSTIVAFLGLLGTSILSFISP
jgi:putative exporter of polyketide antibiotics